MADSCSGKLDIKILCDTEKNYDQMKSFVENSDPLVFKTEIDNVINESDTYLNTDSLEKYKLLLMLRLFNKMKSIEKQRDDDNHKREEYYLHYLSPNKKMYENSDTDHINAVHQFNNKDKTNIPESEYYDLLKKSMTICKMDRELLTYELLHYLPKEQYGESLNIPCMVKCILDHFNPLIQQYMEDNVWLINYKSTLNFAVSPDKVVISNTISNLNAHNSIMIMYLDLMKRYIKNMFKLSSFKYMIIEDTKYDVTWVLWIIGTKIKKKKVEPKKIESKKIESKKIECKKIECKKIEPKKIEAKTS